MKWLVAVMYTVFWGVIDGWRWIANLGLSRVSLVKPRDLVWARQVRIMKVDLVETRHLEIVPASANHGNALFVPVSPAVVSLRKPVSFRKSVVWSPVVVDELGAWDPSTADWSEPAFYRELTIETMRSWGPLVPDGIRANLVSDIADTVLCGV
jgi:hypothetical protein